MTYDPSLYNTLNLGEVRAHGQQHVTSATSLTSLSSSLVTVDVGAASAYTINLPDATIVAGTQFDFKVLQGLITVQCASAQTIDGHFTKLIDSSGDELRLAASIESGAGYWRIVNEFPYSFTVSAASSVQYYVSAANSNLPNAVLLNSDNPLAITNGGTGASSATAARSNLSMAKSGVNSDITDTQSLIRRQNAYQWVTGTTTLSSSSPGTTMVWQVTGTPYVQLPAASSVDGQMFTIVNEGSAGIGQEHYVSTQSLTNSNDAVSVFSPDQSTLYAVMNGFVQFIDTNTFLPTASALLTGFSGAAASAHTVQDGCITTSGDLLYLLNISQGVIHVVDTALKQQTALIKLSSSPITFPNGSGMTITSDNQRLIVSVSSAIASIFTASLVVDNQSLVASSFVFYMKATSNNHLWVANGTDVRAYTASNGSLLYTFPFSGVGFVEKDRRGRVYAAGSVTPGIAIFDDTSLSLVKIMSGVNPVYGFKPSSDGRQVYLSQSTGVIDVYDVDSSSLVYRLQSTSTTHCRLDVAGTHFVGGGMGDRKVSIWVIDYPVNRDFTIVPATNEKIGGSRYFTSTTYTLSSIQDAVTLQSCKTMSGWGYRIINKVVN